jgi:DNA-binding NtrC family response regulator
MRLNPSLALRVPPLAERREDLPELARLTASAFFADPRHARAIASLVRAAGAPEPAGAFDLALAEEHSRKSGASAVFVVPRKAWTAVERHPWPGNVRQFEMVVTDALAAAVYGGPETDSSGRAVFRLDARMLFDLLAGARAGGGAPSAGSAERLPRAPTVAQFRRELERAALRRLFRESGGDFRKMAEAMTGSRREARAVRLRFNKLGLSARGER